MIEKVVNAFKNCIDTPKCRDCCWTDCDVFHETVEIPRSLASEVMKIIERYEPKKVKFDDSLAYYCPECNTRIFYQQKYCSECGQGVKWGE